MYKVASAAVQQVVKEDEEREGMALDQFAPEGAEALLLAGKAMLQLKPPEAFGTLDAKNAYGTILRSAMLEATVD